MIQVATSCYAEHEARCAHLSVHYMQIQDKLSFYHVSLRLDNEIIGETDENDDHVTKLAVDILINKKKNIIPDISSIIQLYSFMYYLYNWLDDESFPIKSWKSLKKNTLKDREIYISYDPDFSFFR